MFIAYYKSLEVWQHLRLAVCEVESAFEYKVLKRQWLLAERHQMRNKQSESPAPKKHISDPCAGNLQMGQHDQQVGENGGVQRWVSGSVQLERLQ